jgi:ribosomal protein S18 acetylase RimI-like enzyme
MLFREIGMVDVAGNPPHPAASFRSAIRDRLVWVAEAEVPVGFALVEDHGAAAHLEEIAVRRAHGRSGVGTALIRHAMSELAARGYATLTLSTFAAVPWNRPFYESLGFEVVPEGEWSPVLRRLRDSERAAGLAIGARVIMRRRLAAEG